MRRRAKLFRGSEFPRLVLLLGIMAVGWPLVCRNGGPRAAGPAPPRAIDVPPPLPPATGPEFAGLHDRTTLNPRDNPAYAKLLERARKTTHAQIAQVSRKEVLFTSLLERPDLYRGVPIRVVGTARRVLLSDGIGPALSPKGRLYEAWTITRDSQNHPYCLVFEDPPKDLAVGPDLFEAVYFDGYFLKIISYQAGDGARAAPLLVGRLGTWGPTAAPAASQPGWLGKLPWPVIPLAALTLFGFLRWGLMLRRQFAPVRRISLPKSLTPTDTIEADELANWLDQTTNDGPDDPDRFPDGKDGR